MVETSAADVHPPYLYPDYKSTRLRAPAQPLVRVAPSPLEAAGPSFPQQFVKDSEADLTTWGTSAPLGEKMVLVGRVLDEDGRPVRGALVEVWQANASGKYPPSRRRPRRAARPELPRQGPGAHRRRGPLPDRDGQARRVSVGEPRVRMAAGAHPLLALRQRVRPAAHHADVLPRRSAARDRSDLPERPRGGRARCWSPISTCDTASRASRSDTGGTSCCAGTRATPMGI